jgi:hypothetical protein
MPNYSHGRRRRRISVNQTPVVSPAQSNQVQPPRRFLPVVIRRPQQPARVIVLRTPQLHGSFQGARPQISIVRLPQIRNAPKPIVARTRALPNIPPPTQRWQPRPLVTFDYSRQGRWRPIQTRTSSGRLPSPAMPAPAIVGRWRPGPPAIRPSLYRTRTPQVSAGIAPQPVIVSRRPVKVISVPAIVRRTQLITPSLVAPRPLALRLPTIPWRVRPVINIRSHAQAQARPVPRLIIPIQTAQVRLRPALPWAKYLVSTRSLLIHQPTPTKAIIIPFPRQPVRPRPPIQVKAASGLFGPQRTQLTIPLIVRMPRQPVRQPRITQLGGGVGHTVTLPMRPTVTARPPALKIWPRPVSPAARYPLASPSLHGPMPRPLIFTRPRGFDQRRFAQYLPISSIADYPTQGQNPVNPPQPGQPTLPNDLVAAAIIWLRQQPAIVSAFGDSATTPKFGSDISLPKTSLPYLNFSEPDEDESYESADYTGQPSSLSDGVLGIDLVGTSKLQVRLLAEQVSAVLNDAPLTFADGVLVYLRRMTRKFPTFRETGPGTNVVIFKRYLEFDFKIERWKPSF